MMGIHWRKTTYLYYCACAYISFLLVFLGLVSSAWAESDAGSDEYDHYGLLAYCKHSFLDSRHECGVTGFGGTAWFDAARVFALASTILLFSVTPVSCYLFFQDERREDLILLTIFGVITCIVGVLGAILYAVLRDSHMGALSWGFNVYVAGHVLAMVSFLFLCCVNYCCPKKKPEVRPYYM